MSTSQLDIVKLMDAVTIDGETKYSSTWSFQRCTGSACVLIVSTAGTLKIVQQCSYDGGKTWYNPYDITTGELGIVVAAETVTTGVYRVYTPVLADLIRFAVTESTAASVVSLTLIARVEV
jgi:hypothetical protein